MGSSSRRFAIYPDRWLGASLPDTSVSFDSIPARHNAFATGSLRLPQEQRVFRFSRPPGDFRHNRQTAPPYALSLSIQSPCVVASRNPEESIV